MGGRRESDTALLHGLSQCDSQCGSLDASIARQRRTIAQLSAIRTGGRPQRPVMIAATCQVAEVPLITSLLLLLPAICQILPDSLSPPCLWATGVGFISLR